MDFEAGGVLGGAGTHWDHEASARWVSTEPSAPALNPGECDLWVPFPGPSVYVSSLAALCYLWHVLCGVCEVAVISVELTVFLAPTVVLCVIKNKYFQILGAPGVSIAECSPAQRGFMSWEK